MRPTSVITATQDVPTSAKDAYELARALDPAEMALLSPRHTEKRLAEFVAGRIAARKAVARLLGILPASPSLLILRDGTGPTGRPIVQGSELEESPHVSISHADGLAIAAASFGRVGIDLATLAEQDRSFVEEAFSERELDGWAAWLGAPLMSAITVTAAFAAKEAALKWLGTGFGLPLRSVETAPKDGAASSEARSFSSTTALFRFELQKNDHQAPVVLNGSLSYVRTNRSVLQDVRKCAVCCSSIQDTESLASCLSYDEMRVRQSASLEPHGVS